MTPPASGYRPALKVGDVFTSCAVHAQDDTEVFEPGRTYNVLLEVLFWDEYRDRFTKDLQVELFEGSRCVGRGSFSEPPAVEQPMPG
ncbi:MAG: hypothetical protein QM765_33275 [Myxococcales bacterium]